MRIPDGFAPVSRSGPFMAGVGPVHVRMSEDGPVIGLYIEARHTNLMGIAHGGVLATLADNALGYTLSHTRTPPLSLVTVSLTTDFFDSARPGDWLEAHTRVRRIGARLAYASCELRVGERAILGASGVFAQVSPPTHSG